MKSLLLLFLNHFKKFLPLLGLEKPFFVAFLFTAIKMQCKTHFSPYNHSQLGSSLSLQPKDDLAGRRWVAGQTIAKGSGGHHSHSTVWECALIITLPLSAKARREGKAGSVGCEV